ncbi:MAG: nucleotidyltransferase [Elusimicrobia bacterium]|nr:nucleotidyltransferase [Elusimicrobiota bacterium]
MDAPSKKQEATPEQEFYRRAMLVLIENHCPFLVGGAYALDQYTGISRRTKDIDFFVRPEDCERTMGLLSSAGYRTERTFEHWLGKAFSEDFSIDIIYGSGNGLCLVDPMWFERAISTEVLGLSVNLCPPEEIIWSKAYIMERERFDGADVMHIIHSWGGRLDWAHLMHRFGSHWRVLLFHLVLFGFVYPAEQTKIPKNVMRDMIKRLQEESEHPPMDERVCRGTLLSRAQYLPDTEDWKYKDARLQPRGNMSQEQVAMWTQAYREEAAKAHAH